MSEQIDELMKAKDVYALEIMDYLKANFLPLVPKVVKQMNEIEHEKNRLSRSLAPLVLSKEFGLSPVDVITSIVDGGDDGGIDAIFFEGKSKRLIFAQSKIGTKAPDQGETLKVIDGVEKLLRSNFETFNDSVKSKAITVKEALDDHDTTIELWLLHLGDEIGRHATGNLEAFCSKINENGEVLRYVNFNLDRIYQYLVREFRPLALDIRLEFKKWNIDQSNGHCLYGVVSAKEIGSLVALHGKELFQKNIRQYMGDTSVNENIRYTVTSQPQALFFLNNGITAVCRTIRKNPAGNNDRATFSIEGVSFVNGAQTAGTLGTLCRENQAIDDRATIMMTVITVGEDNTLADHVTRARNTQNTIRSSDFAALDPTQERLRTELSLISIQYSYRTSEKTQLANTITIADAAVAIACTKGNVDLSVVAQKGTSDLLDMNQRYYATLFTDSLTGMELARRVAVFNYIKEVLKGEELSAKGSSRRQLYFRHGSYFISIMYARKFQTDFATMKPELNDEEKLAISRKIIEVAEDVYQVAEREMASSVGYLAIFRKLETVRPLAASVGTFLNSKKS